MSPERRLPGKPAPARKVEPSYHHGNLRAAIVAETLALVEEEGVAAVSVRGLAKRLGVSPGAPFRHFASKRALLTAVATEAMEHFAAAVQAELDRSREQTPRGRLRAIGRGYLRWALANRAQFAIISNHEEIDFAHAGPLQSLSESVMRQMDPCIVALFPDSGNKQLASRKLVCRALVYGLARMATDGHFEEWNIRPDRQLAAVEAVLDQFIAMVAGAD
jgi:AcrR family transcriptional regulator